MVTRSAVPATALATALLLAAGNAVTAGELRLRPGMTGVADIGSTGCALFNEMHYNGPTGMQHQVLTWVQGYLYAHNETTIDSILAALPADNGWDFDSLSAVFVDYCKAKPEANVSEAAIALSAILLDGKSAPPRRPRAPLPLK
ncbi:MAG: hypothetical protein OEV14_07710 [Gammaproteobacteria bacterium]|nr:hypothetical protein [Gammaproteobacteria bacterium]